MGPLAVEMDTIYQTQMAGVWDEIPLQRRIELMAWVRALSTMRAWEQFQAERH